MPRFRKQSGVHGTPIHTVSAAARVREELNGEVEVAGRAPGPIEALVDGGLVLDGRHLPAPHVLPSAEQVLDALAARSPALIDEHGATL